jgi:hypothetical protein
MQERFQKSELIRVSAYLTPDEHRRFKAWCIPQDRGPEAALARLIRETIGGGAHAAAEARAGVQLPPRRELNLTGVKRAPGFDESADDEPTGSSQPDPHGFVPPKALPGSELSTQAEAVAKYSSLVSAGEWIPDAMAKVDEIWKKNGLIYMWNTVALPEYVKEEYRERAKAAGRDPEPDLRLHEDTTERI